MEPASKRQRRNDLTRRRRSYRQPPHDWWVFTALHLKPDGRYGFDRRLVNAYTREEAIALSGLDPAHGLAAVAIPSEAEYRAALSAEAAGELEQHQRTA